MEGILKIRVDVVKYDGTNKQAIIDRLKIDSYKSVYFKNKNVYFIIPKNDESEWFILTETELKERIDLV